MQEILLAYGILEETVAAIMMLYKNARSMLRSPDGDTNGELISGKGVEEFSYQARVGTVNVKLLLIDVST